MSTREEILSGFYGEIDEESRLIKSRHGQLEFVTTMAYIHRYAKPGDKIIEIGAGTGRYSISLAKEGMDVTAVELVEKNLRELKENSKNLENIQSFQGDATDLSRFADDSFDVTLIFGPMYHLYEEEEINKAIDEAIRITKKDGILLFAFLSVYGIMYANYLQGNWAEGEDENFTSDYKFRHFKEQLFTGYDIEEFENLFSAKKVSSITTVGVDGILEAVEKRADFEIKDEDFDAFAKWYLAFSDKRELLGCSNHLLYICRKD